MKYLTIRNVPDDLASALEREKLRRGQSLNETVLQLLQQGLGVGTPRSNGLAALAGGWTEEDLREFEEAAKVFEEIDRELWE